MALRKNITGGRSSSSCTFLILIFLTMFLMSNAASAADTGWVAPTSNSSGSGVTSPQNAYVDDTSYASFNGGGSSNWTYGYDFSSIPSGATIDGIEVNALGSRISGSASTRYMRVRLSWNSGTTWTSYSTNTTEWTTSVVDHYLGGAADNWGRSWTRDEIVNGFRVQAQWMASSTSSDANLDYIPVRVYYTLGAGTTYSVSGYVTNASNGAVISGATVSVNSTPTQMTSTNGTGYYNFSLINGTYLIAATSINYNANSITRTVIGFPLTNADIALTPAPAGTGGKILVASNRYVVLDDPKTGSFSGTGFKNPSNSWSTDTITGVETTITMWAMLIDSNGMPMANRNVNFTLKNPVGANDYTFTKSTDNNGLVNVTRDLNNKNYYGNWQIKADYDGLSQSSSFIYNWWGCGGGAGCSGHNNEAWASGAAINSPYSTGHDGVVGARSDHQGANNCMYCHLSYNGQGSTAGMNTADRHSSFTCTDGNCHGSISSHNSNMVIGSCNNCHTRGNITKKSTLNGILSNYSTTSTYHDQNSTIPCVICHGPMHNITKPDPTVGGLNDITEDTHCTTCHTTYEKHNGGVGCTLCHSQDVHAIKVFSQAAGYVNKGSANQGNCTNCHQDASFLTTLKSAPKAGAYAGSAPQVQKPLNHSTDSPGTKWGTYWTSQNDACKYCHGDSKHSATGLGLVSVAVGTDTVGGPIGTGTVCASCHNSTDNDYGAIMALLIPDPVAFKPGLNWNTSGTDHASYGTTDADCKSCHDGVLSGPSATIGEFVHNVDKGKAGGPDCVTCHDIGGSPEKVDVTNIKNSIHVNLNTGGSAGSYSPDSKICWGCHTNDTVSADGRVDAGEIPSNSHPDKYNSPKKCTQCHTGSGKFGALIASEHNSAGTEIKTKPQTDTNTSCVNCHMKSEMIRSNSDPGTRTDLANVSHYGKNQTGASPYNVGGASNCTFCHQGSSAFGTEMVNAAWNASVDNHTELGTNPGCTNTNCHNSGRIHESSLTKPALVLPNSSYCLTCHTTVQKHNGSLNCDQCHLETNKNIHPVQYLQPSGTFLINSATNKASAVNCTNCHQGIMSGFISAPQVNKPLNHSTDRSGTKWGTYWTTQNGACLYCHGNNKHNATRFGNASVPVGTDQIGGTIGTGTLCSSCHNSGDSNYLATMNILNPDPVANVPVTNYNSSGTNHSTYGTTDADCLPCHGSALSASPTMSEFPHNVATATGCTACHGQPPNGLSRNNTDGAHTLHKNAGYGNIPQTGCNYCHSNGGINDNNGARHPNNIYNVSFNASVSSISYAQNPLSGRDDTCAGVSCHTNGLSVGAKAGTAIWNSSTAGRCDVCHSASASGMPSTGNHSRHYVTNDFNVLSQCSTCHGTNADFGIQTGHKNNSIIDISFTGPLASSGSINATKSCTVYCHSPNNNDNKPKPTWGATLGACGTSCHTKPPAITRTGSTVHTGLIGSSDCEGCHGAGANSGTQTGHINRVVDGSGASCTGCHSNVGLASLGLHSNLSGTVSVEDSDCTTCHFGSFPMITGAANSANTHYCQDCHTTAGSGPVKPQPVSPSNPLIKDGLSHGSADCKWCHAAGDQPTYKYHALGPKGTATGANCATCHVSANIPDAPFFAPGEAHSSDLISCGECHTPSDNHAVQALSDSSSPTLSAISVTTPITSGTSAQIQAAVTDGMVMIATAQYQVTNISGTVIPWTNMTALDGRFDSAYEIVNSTMSTSNMIGTYTVSIKGMASAYKTDTSIPYYPLNGMWSGVSSTTLIVTQPRGYVNGTVRNGANAIAGAVVSTNTGESAITDSNGNYSMNLVIGNHQLTARKDPEYYPGSSLSVTIDTALPITQNFNLNKKLTGTIIGTVRII